MTAIPLAESKPPFIVAIDIGTSSARASIYDRAARRVDGLDAQRAYRMTATADGGVEIDPDKLIDLIVETIDELHALVSTPQSATEIAGVAVTTFWHAMMGIDERARPMTPLFSWNDTRARSAAADLRARLDERDVHARTGCMIHSSYWPAKIVWLLSGDPELATRVTRWISPADYFFFRLFGGICCSTSMASATGLFNQRNCAWDDEMLSAIGVSARNLPELRDLDQPFTTVSTKTAPGFAARWPMFSGAKWFPAIGDGACSNIGSGCVTPNQAAINIGTSGALRVLGKKDAGAAPPPRGAWCYRADRERLLTGGALSNGGNLIAWLRDSLNIKSLAEVEAAANRMEPDSHGLTVLPFLSGERSTGWIDSARLVLSGATLDTTPADVIRASLEAVAFRFAAIYEVLSSSGAAPLEIVTSGAAASALKVWNQIIADVLGKPVTLSPETEATSRGAALMALEAMGLIDDLESAAIAKEGTIFHPDKRRHEVYKQARERQERLYTAVFGSLSTKSWTE